MRDASGGKKRWTSTFERIPEDKRRRVLESAKRAFARHGFAGTNVNALSREAGISVGSLYKYFRSKEDIFLALIEYSHGVLAQAIDEILERTSGFFERIEQFLWASIETATRDPEQLNLYIACTTEELAPLAARLSSRIESIAASRYHDMIVQAKARGEIREDVDEGMAAFCLDDLMMLVQFSFASPYYRERLALFLGAGASDEPEAVVRGVLDFARRALGPAR